MLSRGLLHTRRFVINDSGERKRERERHPERFVHDGIYRLTVDAGQRDVMIAQLRDAAFDVHYAPSVDTGYWDIAYTCLRTRSSYEPIDSERTEAFDRYHALLMSKYGAHTTPALVHTPKIPNSHWASNLDKQSQQLLLTLAGHNIDELATTRYTIVFNIAIPVGRESKVTEALKAHGYDDATTVERWGSVIKLGIRLEDFSITEQSYHRTVTDIIKIAKKNRGGYCGWNAIACVGC